MKVTPEQWDGAEGLAAGPRRRFSRAELAWIIIGVIVGFIGLVISVGQHQEATYPTCLYIGGQVTRLHDMTNSEQEQFAYETDGLVDECPPPHRLSIEVGETAVWLRGRP